MTVDIATLAIRIDSMEAREAARDMDRLSGAGRRAEQQGGALTGAMRTLAGVLATMKVVEFAESLIKTQREFDKLNSSLITATGSVGNAAQAFGALQAFAASTPYGLAEVTKAFIQLRNLGLTPSERALNSYGNTASAMGKSLSQMVEAVADAATGEFERLKEFGIKAKQNGDVVSLTFQGVTSNIQNNAASIEKYLIGLGETKFAGGMELQAKTLDGAISNLGDTWDMTKLAFSQSGFGDGALAGVLGMTNALQDLQAVLRATGLAADNEGKAVEEAGALHKVLTATFELAAVSGELVAFTLRAIGKDIGAIAAASVAVATGELGQVSAIFRARKADAAEDERMTDARIEKILWASAVEKKVRENAAAEKSAEGRDDLARYAVKQAAVGMTAEAIKKERESYVSLIGPLREKNAANNYEIENGKALTESQKAVISLNEDLKNKKISLTKEHEREIRALIESTGAQDQWLKSALATKAAIEDLVDQRRQDYAAAAAEANANELAAQNFGKTKAEIEALTVARLEDRIAHAADLEITVDDIYQTERLISAKKRSVDALTKTDALGYIKQLSDENRRFAADSIIDEKARAAALTEIDAEIWRKRIALAGEGTDQQKALQEQYNVWYANQALKPIIDAQREAVKKYDDVFRQGFADMLNHGKSGWQSFTKSLTTTFKTSVADQLYKMFAQPLVVNLVGNMLGLTGAAGAAANGAAGAAGGALTGAALGTTLGAIGTGAFQTAGAVLTGQIGLFDTIGAGVSALSTGTLSGMTAGLSSLAGALGPIALGVAAIMTLAKHWDDSGTIHTGGAASASAAGVKNIDAGTLGFQRINTADGTNQLTSQLAASVVSILDSTATAFGKTAGYTAATAFADDTSKDGAWGALIISNMNGLVSQWGDANSRWAPKVFSDGEAGQKEYLAMLSSSVRSALDGIGLPAWAKSMLDNLGNAPSLEELAKVVDTINATQSALTIMGQRLKGFAGLADDAVTELIKASGGVDKLATNASAFFDSYYSDSEKTAVITKQVADALKAVGLQMPATRDEYRALIEQQLALGTSGATAAAALLKNAEAYAKFVPAVEDSTTSLEKAKSDLAEAYSAESEAIKNTIKNTQDYVKSLIGLRDSLMISDLSPLTPVEQYAEAARQYEATRAAAMSGDATAQSGLQNAITAFLKASRTVNASSDQYKDDYAKVQADLAIAIASGKSQVSTAEASLNALNKQVAGLTAVNESVLSVAAAIKQLTAIMGDGGNAIASTNATSSISSLYQSLLGRAPDAGGLQFWTTQMGNGLSISAIANAMMQSPEYLSLHGSHANGLRHVPFNRYRAELHEGEGVLTKSENQSYLALFGGSGGGLLTEFRAMRAEIAELRKEQAQQTGALIASNFRANAEAAETVATATLDAAETSAWASKTAPRVDQ